MIDYILQGHYNFNRPVYITRESKCILLNQGNTEEICELRSNHKEADPRIALHAFYDSSKALGKPISVVSDDTDVFIILLSVVDHMKGVLYFRQGKNTTGSGIEYHNVSALAEVLGKHCCKNLPAFHALTGCDFTYPFFRRAKYQAFVMMMNLRKAKKRLPSVHLLVSLGTFDPNFSEITDFVLHTIYNRPRTELSPTDSRVAMLRTEKPKCKDKKRKCRSTKDIPPDGRSLEMKIRRANLVTYDWKHCFNQYHNPFLPTQCGWELKDNTLLPKWYEGSNLPTDDEYDGHIKQMFNLQQ